MPSAQLLELYAQGLGVIDEARLECGPGFNVLTGETGAGKTLLLGALGLSLGVENVGARAAVDTATRVAAVFRRADGSETVLARESSAGGRLRSSVDGAPSSAEALRALSRDLVVIHGQHDSLALRSRGDARRLLDRSASISTDELEAVRQRLRQARAELAGLGGDDAARARERDLIEFEISEIEAARIAGPSELSEVVASLTRLTELRAAQESLAMVVADLDGEGDGATLASLARSIESLPHGEAVDPARAELRGALEQARDAVRSLSALMDEEVDPAALNVLEGRVTLLQALARKYGGNLPAVLERVEVLRAERTQLDNAHGRVAALDQEISDLGEREAVLAGVARGQRDAAAMVLNEALTGQLPRVALADASLSIVVDGADGGEVSVLFSANPGRPAGPLELLASGGELSRVLLALSLETVSDGVVAVFDEVDAGVGGQVAQQIGQCLAELGRTQQVLAVTHLASVAARADRHFVIEKHVRDGATNTEVRRVEGEERVREIARMLAGSAAADESRALAVRLLETVN